MTWQEKKWRKRGVAALETYSEEANLHEANMSGYSDEASVPNQPVARCLRYVSDGTRQQARWK